MTSPKTFDYSETCHHQVKESIAREAACRELERQGDGESGEGRRGERETGEVGGRQGEERPNLPPSPHSPPHSRPSPSLPQYSLSSQVCLLPSLPTSTFTFMFPFTFSFIMYFTFSPSFSPGSCSAKLQHPAARSWSSPHLLPPLPPGAPSPLSAHLLLVLLLHTSASRCQLPRRGLP